MSISTPRTHVCRDEEDKYESPSKFSYLGNRIKSVQSKYSQYTRVKGGVLLGDVSPNRCPVQNNTSNGILVERKIH